MEELLNKLIRKGWNPFGGYKHSTPRESCNVYGRYITFHCNDGDYDYPDYKSQDYNIRELVSKESDLWQFCCENGMVKMKEGFYWQNIFPLDSKEYDYTDYQYWILESSLKDEEDLEEFLLDNIKIEDRKKELEELVDRNIDVAKRLADK